MLGRSVAGAWMSLRTGASKWNSWSKPRNRIHHTSFIFLPSSSLLRSFFTILPATALAISLSPAFSCWFQRRQKPKREPSHLLAQLESTHLLQCHDKRAHCYRQTLASKQHPNKRAHCFWWQRKHYISFWHVSEALKHNQNNVSIVLTHQDPPRGPSQLKKLHAELVTASNFLNP